MFERKNKLSKRTVYTVVIVATIIELTKMLISFFFKLNIVCFFLVKENWRFIYSNVTSFYSIYVFQYHTSILEISYMARPR